MAAIPLTAERLRELLDYHWETGEFHWRVPKGRIAAGSLAGGPNVEGYIKIHIDCRTYSAHRLAWLYVSGEFPANQIDHANGKSGDNGIKNLREANPWQNKANSRRYKNNRSGTKGVCFWSHGQKWKAAISKGGVKYHLGFFDRKEDAIAARIAAQEMHGEFARL